MKKILIFSVVSILFVSLIVLQYGCGKVVGEPGVVGGAGVSGKVFAANGTTPIGGCTVSNQPITSSSISKTQANQTHTNPDGSFFLALNPGTYTIYFASGKFKFQQDNVKVEANKTTNLGDKEFDPAISGVTVPDMAVITGSYDSIEDIIQSLGYSPTIINESDLQSLAAMNQYDIIFINCDADLYYDDATVQSNLQNFTNAGGSLYASDWAHPYIEGAFPNNIKFMNENGTFNPGDAKIGTGSQTVQAKVVDQTLKNTVLGKDNVSIYFDLGAWVVIDSVGTGTSVLLSADVQVSSTTTPLTNKPVGVKFSYGSGNIIYTSFHNEAQATEDMKKILAYYIFNL